MKEPTFSFIAYGLDIDEREKVYANIKPLKQKLETVANYCKSQLHLKNPIKTNLDISDKLNDLMTSLNHPIESLLSSTYNKTNSEDVEFVKFVQSIAMATINPVNFEQDVLFHHHIDLDIIKPIMTQLMVGLSYNKEKKSFEGEMIFPLTKINKTVFLYSFTYDDNQIGAFLLIAETSKRFALYRWAKILVNEFAAITNEYKKYGAPKQLPDQIRKRLISLYHIELLFDDNLLQSNLDSDFKKEVNETFHALLRMKNVENFLHSLIVAEKIVITSDNYEKAEKFVKKLDILFPYQKLVLNKTSEHVQQNLDHGTILYIPDESNSKTISKAIPIINLDKNNIRSGKSSSYTKDLTKRLKKISKEDLTSTMKNEIIFLFNEVDDLLTYAKIDDKTEAKTLIDTQIKNLPQKNMFQAIRRLAINYNPILEDLIISRADYKFQQVFG